MTLPNVPRRLLYWINGDVYRFDSHLDGESTAYTQEHTQLKFV